MDGMVWYHLSAAWIQVIVTLISLDSNSQHARVVIYIDIAFVLAVSIKCNQLDSHHNSHHNNPHRVHQYKHTKHLPNVPLDSKSVAFVFVMVGVLTAIRILSNPVPRYMVFGLSPPLNTLEFHSRIQPALQTLYLSSKLVKIISLPIGMSA